MSELVERGDIKQYWERKIEEERSRGLEVEMDYHSAITALEQEKNFQETALAELVKQKAALDCQEQLLSSLKAEVTDMTEKLSSERAKIVEEQHGIQDIQHDLQVNFERLLDTKSILEAEVEALRILSERLVHGKVCLKSVVLLDLTYADFSTNICWIRDPGLRMRQEKAKLVQRSLRRLAEGGNGTVEQRIF
ncbi:UNVERIFIED_CONTAM: hypothetical protein Scaly_0938800 [Sesamum calycinum]|uniref:Uncharacterized protein n=1 Tax=Sesamum calycinum TaxID=2727403 RepID=A0AAW2QXQ4_9LAMI